MIINIGDFIVGETVYPNRCLSASFGGQGVEVEELPWKEDENPYDYIYQDGEFLLDKLILPQDNSQRITELKQMLKDTDYCVIKIAEGVKTKEDYEDVITQREQWRAEIRELESQEV